MERRDSTPGAGCHLYARFPGALLLVLLLTANPLGATGGPLHEIRIGVLNHDTDNLWSGFRREHGTDLNLEFVFEPSATLFRGELRPALGVTANLSGDTSKLYAYGRWERDFHSPVFVALGLGLALHDGKTDLVRPDRKALGTRALIHTSLEIGVRFHDRHSIALYFDHVSNADLADENEGLDTLGIRYGLRL